MHLFLLKYDILIDICREPSSASFVVVKSVLFIWSFALMIEQTWTSAPSGDGDLSMGISLMLESMIFV
ncbi:hypothetical protein RND71_005256 [Anisodus tanguticus]|uniref:Uncharacterized protein n=1 Tax=Anisodus tanguticus TaxID=243964 RepID=A0AAE1SPP1_9SOLA|nr:hypothetical protein RND71_005256 [Anisodus tanguticus]